MTERSVTHATFRIERVYDASPARAFAAFADPVAKLAWFKGPPESETLEREFEFRVGGREHNVVGPPGGVRHVFDAIYQDIVPNERIIFTYDMHLDETRISVSATTIEIKPAGAATRLMFTEQGAFLDGFDNGQQRETGTRHLLDALGASLSTPLDDNDVSPINDPSQAGLKASVVIERLLDAPVASDWRAWTDPVQLASWWGPDGYTSPVCEIDPRPGGAVRIVMRAPDGAEHPMTATILDIVEHRTIVWTAAAFGMDGEKHLEGITTITFADEDGKTRLVVQADAAGLTPRSRLMLGGMEAGWAQSIERLAALVEAEG